VEDDAGEVRYRLVVPIFAWPAFVMTAIGDDPATAAFVIAVVEVVERSRSLVDARGPLPATRRTRRQIVCDLGQQPRLRGL